MTGSYKSTVSVDGTFSLEGKEKLLVFETDFVGYHLAFIRAGIERYFEQGGRSLSYVQVGVADLLELMGPAVSDRLAVIGMIRSPIAAKAMAQKNIPFMNLAGQGTSVPFTVAFEGEGVLAANYLIDEGKYENLGYIGCTHAVTYERRFREFSDAAAKKGIQARSVWISTNKLQQHFWDVPEDEWTNRRDAIMKFLEEIPKPAGIFCASDALALRAFYMAGMLGIRVPEELAILGIGSNDNSKANWAHVASVVQLDHQALGYFAAKLMDEYLSSGTKPRSVSLGPASICHSQTTLRRAVADSVVSRALMIIQKDPSVEALSLCEQLKMTRSVLDQRFQRVTGMTIAKAIEVERFSIARNLIRREDYNLEAIAAIAGYPNRRGMRRSFYRFTRMSPRQFREMTRSEHT